MADAEVVKYNKTIEKLCVDYAADVGKELAGCKQIIKNRLAKLTNDIPKISVPSAADLSKVLDLVEAIMMREGASFRNVLIMEPMLRVAAGKLVPAGAGVSGPMALI
jgi:hypothetical protein